MIPHEIRQALEATGLEWEIVLGTKHRKIIVAGLFCGILPRGRREQEGRAMRNVVAQIRRAGNVMKENHNEPELHPTAFRPAR